MFYCVKHIKTLDINQVVFGSEANSPKVKRYIQNYC